MGKKKKGNEGKGGGKKTEKKADKMNKKKSMHLSQANCISLCVDWFVSYALPCTARMHLFGAVSNAPPESFQVVSAWIYDGY